MPAGHSTRFVPQYSCACLPTNVIMSLCVYFLIKQSLHQLPSTLPLARHVILSWVESFSYTSGRDSWARLVTTHREALLREERCYKRCSRSIFCQSSVFHRIKIRLGHLPKTSWPRGSWICFRTCPFLGSWRALLCEDVHNTAGRECSVFLEDR